MQGQTLPVLKLTQYRRLRGARKHIDTLLSEMFYCTPTRAMEHAPKLQALAAEWDAILEANAGVEVAKAQTVPAAALDPRTPEQIAADAAEIDLLMSGSGTDTVAAN
jgi:hypothetical protein